MPEELARASIRDCEVFFFTTLKALSTTIIRVTHYPPLSETQSTEVHSNKLQANQSLYELNNGITKLKLIEPDLRTDMLRLELKTGYNPTLSFTYSIAQLLSPPQNARGNREWGGRSFASGHYTIVQYS